jgi:predicted transglutaminase-like cysteine proteinase
MSKKSDRLARIRRRARIKRRAQAKKRAQKPQSRDSKIQTYENSFAKQRITYNGRHIKSKGKDVKINIDVRNFIQPDHFVYNFAKVSGALNTTSLDQKAWLIQKAVCKYMTYVFDKQNIGYTEFWQFPFETLALKCGDCEDGAILMASAMLAAGIPNSMTRVYASWVKTRNKKQPWGGHAYVVYLRSTDIKPVPLDWCYLADPNIPIQSKKPINENKNYGKVWFSFNDKDSWGDKPVRFASRANLENKFTDYGGA